MTSVLALTLRGPGLRRGPAAARHEIGGGGGRRPLEARGAATRPRGWSRGSSTSSEDPAAGRAGQRTLFVVRVRAVDAARGRDLRAACGHAGLPDRSRPRRHPRQRSERWSPSFPILAFMSGLLLAFALRRAAREEQAPRDGRRGGRPGHVRSRPVAAYRPETAEVRVPEGLADRLCGCAASTSSATSLTRRREFRAARRSRRTRWDRRRRRVPSAARSLSRSATRLSSAILELIDDVPVLRARSAPPRRASRRSL